MGPQSGPSRGEFELLKDLIETGFMGINVRLDRLNGRVDKSEDRIRTLEVGCPLLHGHRSGAPSEALTVKQQGRIIAVGLVVISGLVEALHWAGSALVNAWSQKP